MSCGHPHQTPCSDVLKAVFLYLDQEISEPQKLEAITLHLQECPPCGAQYEVEQRIHELVARSCSCGCDPAPEQVRQRVIERITELRIEMTLGEPDSE